MKPIRSQPRLRGIIAKNSIPPRTTSPVMRELFNDMSDRVISQASVADAIGVSQVAMSHWRHGVTTPKLMDVEAFAEVMGYRMVLEKIQSSDAGTVRNGD
jgi:predicted transcriptional regulator